MQFAGRILLFADSVFIIQTLMILICLQIAEIILVKNFGCWFKKTNNGVFGIAKVLGTRERATNKSEAGIGNSQYLQIIKVLKYFPVIS
jgi:hypothetical protein